MLSWIIALNAPVFTLFGEPFSWRDLILIAGGVFLLYKAVHEMHTEIEEPQGPGLQQRAMGAMSAIVSQIIVLDLVFSIDSIVTAIGMAQHVEVMIAAVVVAVALMFVASGPIAGFVSRHPTTKMLALAFLLLIGVSLVADGLGFHIDKGYIYAAMGFAVMVEAHQHRRQEAPARRRRSRRTGARRCRARGPAGATFRRHRPGKAARHPDGPRPVPPEICPEEEIMSRAVIVHHNGGPEVLALEERDIGAPGPGQVKLRHAAIGLNFIDVYHRTGLYKLELPFVPGIEGAGTVEAVGEGVAELRVGDRVGYSGPHRLLRRRTPDRRRQTRKTP